MVAAAALETQEISIRENLKQQLALEQLRLVCDLSRSLTFGTMIGGTLVAWLMWQGLSPRAALTWYAVHAIVTAARYQLHAALGARIHSGVDVRQARVLVIVGAFVAGAVLGFPATYFIPETIHGQLLLGGTMLGIAAAAVSSLSAVRWAYTAFLVPFYLPFAVLRTFAGGPSVSVALGLMLFGLLMLQLARRYHQHYEDVLRLRFENEALARKLAREKEIAELINRNLQYQVTERERAETSLRTAKAEAEAANRAKSQFLANMSHEVRTPLNAILGMTDLLRQTPLNERQAKFAATAHSAGEQLLSILNDILDLSRVEAGRLRLNKRPFDPRALVREVVDLMSPQALLKGLALEWRVEATVPSTLDGDADRLRQILVNLVSNAVKFTPSGSVTITATLLNEQSTRDQYVVRYAVSDTGPGIAREHQARLFKPFSQVDDSTTRRHGGTGLGLAISRQLVEAMGGHIDVTSESGRGSTFWFELPCTASSAPMTTAPATVATTRAELPRFTARVLVAEDNEVNRTLVIEMLELLGCTTAVASDGAQVLPRIERESFDLVLMDWHMPELDGLSATRLLRVRDVRARNGKPVPVIALTASVMSGDREACLAAGANDYLSKPFTHQALIEKLERWLEKDQG